MLKLFPELNVPEQGRQGIVTPFDPFYSIVSKEGGFFLLNSGPTGPLTDFTHLVSSGPSSGTITYTLPYSAGFYGNDLPFSLPINTALISHKVYAYLYSAGNVRLAIDMYRLNNPVPTTIFITNSTEFPSNPSYFEGGGSLVPISVVMAYSLGQTYDPSSKLLAAMLIKGQFEKFVMRLDKTGTFNGDPYGYSYNHYLLSVVSSH